VDKGWFNPQVILGYDGRL